MLLLVLLVLGVICVWVGHKWFSQDLWEHEYRNITISVVGGVCLFTVILMFIMGCEQYMEAPAVIVKMEEWKESIEYEMDTFTVDDDPILLIQDIKEYNTTIEQGVYWQRNFWVGIIYPNIYNNNDLIAYEGVLE